MAKLINLLPDTKQARLRAQHTRKLLVSSTTAILIIGVAIPVILLIVKGGQSLYLKRTQSQIEEKKATLKNTENIVTMLSVKDHLNSLPALYNQRVVVTKLLKKLPSVMPQDLRLSNLSLDVAGGSLIFTGASGSYASVEKFALALKQHGGSHDPGKVNDPAATQGNFSNVVLQSVSGASGDEVSFTITANFAPNLISSGGSNGI